MTAVDVLSGVLLTAGGLFALVGGIGALRLPDVYTRIHGAGLTDTMGTLLVLMGCALQTGWSLPTAKIAVVLVFLFLTTPTATYALANAARFSGEPPVRSPFEPPGPRR